ncbi:hypothetical protein [Aliidiomarina soli]|uniref:Uncharacterized protein n=1 Tax=Aliidiomarina soli TaxID=1928574 RepID=A0A432WD36_9GAMM|nr:hypothetical protein [Aliidiomarina soli]RUO30322.1 hypothetical protein CWE14_13205 [Aliidiomarina soli]
MLKKTEPVGHIHDIIRDKAGPNHRVLCVTTSISEIKTLDELLGCKVTHSPLMLNNACAVIIHGGGKAARKAQSASTALELPLLYTDFGALKSFRHKAHESLSMGFDHLGFAHDSSRETHLEGLIKTPLDAAQLERTEQIIRQWKSTRASRCNHTTGPHLPGQKFVAVLAEPVNKGADFRASAQATVGLCEQARQAYPGHEIVIVQAEDYAADAISEAAAVFAHSSPVGFEALLWGKRVHVSGMPFYAGWGLTDDRLPAPARRSALEAGVAQLTYAYLVEYSRYVSPYDHKRLTVEEALTLLEKTRPDALAEAQQKAKQRAAAPRWLRWLMR